MKKQPRGCAHDKHKSLTSIKAQLSWLRVYAHLILFVMKVKSLEEQKKYPFPDHCIEDRIEVVKMFGCRHSKRSGMLLDMDWRRLKRDAESARITASQYRFELNKLKQRVKMAFDFFK